MPVRNSVIAMLKQEFGLEVDFSVVDRMKAEAIAVKKQERSVKREANGPHPVIVVEESGTGEWFFEGEVIYQENDGLTLSSSGTVEASGGGSSSQDLVPVKREYVPRY